MWVWSVYLAFPGKLDLTNRGKMYVRNIIPWYFVPVMETLTMSEMRAYEILRDKLRELAYVTKELGKKHEPLSLKNFQLSNLLTSREWNEFMVSPEPRTFKALKNVFGCPTKKGRLKRTYPYLVKMKIEPKKVHP